MSTGTHALGRADVIVRTTPKSGGFFQRVMRRVVEAQERKARDGGERISRHPKR